MNLIEILRQRAAERPATVAIVSGSGSRERTVTLKELDRMSARVAFQLHRAGIGVGDSVLVLEPMGIPLYALLLGLFRIGGVAVLVEPSAPCDVIERCCRRAEVKAVAGVPAALLLKAKLRCVRWSPFYSTRPAAPGIRRLDFDTTRPLSEEVLSAQADALALMTFTSGSGGEPKVAVRTHGFLRTQHAVIERSLSLSAGDVELTTLPVFVIANLASGITSILPDADMRAPARIKAAPVIRQVKRWQPNRALGSPAFFRAFVRAWNGMEAPSFRRVFTGGGPVFPGMIHEIRDKMPGTDVVIVYGSAEAEPISHISVADITPEQWKDMGRGRGLLVGRPIRQIEVRIVRTELGKPFRNVRSKQFENVMCGPWEAGEIVVSGEHVLGGYLDGVGDELAKFRVDGVVWHRTGDAGCLDANGALWLLGRCDAVVRDKHGQMFPFAVECSALQFDWVRSAACVAWEEERTLLVAPARKIDAEERQKLCEAVGWAKLMHVLEVNYIPLDRQHNAKVEYPKLRKLLRDDRYVRRARLLECGEGRVDVGVAT